MTDGALTPDLLLGAYATGIFPMAERRDDPEIFWVDPLRRGIIPLDRLHVSRSLRRRILRGGYEVTYDTDFDGVVAGCAARPETWINDTIRQLYAELHRRGHAHSVEIRHSGALVGGVYGVAIGAAFFGESMFSTMRDASKIALVHLVDRLVQGGFMLLDTQFVTPHLRSLGATEISRGEYRLRLAEALDLPAEFGAAGSAPAPQLVLQRITQTS
ncbi:leucyl/phenylalanyl-tRNA--protein transferase [Roseitranquillus sediminis]|uniref:leucyl/phenylalanyl-tRNA--protein transferase n=1 Tax=Roseitranquillus sediminis TaxID=2809051 RepID=UPI001D0C46AA|nr:leucyl/phenylalanyl-tRNA--protein transferase [Roseitranquillus sediminis]MBM9595694.1 leucyl/phenylalanyl-tRNA--protein transferase [Roseitranquillus sediminis]